MPSVIIVYCRAIKLSQGNHNSTGSKWALYFKDIKLHIAIACFNMSACSLVVVLKIYNLVVG